MYKKIEIAPLTSIQDIEKLFAYTPDAINEKTTQVLEEAQSALRELIALSADKRTWENTAFALDRITAHSNLAATSAVFATLEYLHPQKEIRDAAHEALQRIQNFMIDYVGNNKPLYQAFKAYAQGNALKENLDATQRYFITETMDDFVRAGLELPDDQLAVLGNKKKELGLLTLQFDRAIADDQSTIMCTQNELAGLRPEFLAQLKRDGENYILGMDYPTYTSIMEQCSVEATRKRMSEAFSNRAYPFNDDLLKKIIALRNEIATMLGFASFADYDLSDQMVLTSTRANAFIDNLVTKALAKVEQECERLRNNLPDGVTLDEQGMLKSWDLGYIESEYKKKHFDIDEQVLAEYFPMESTVEALLDIYRQFFSLDFVIEKSINVWHPEVQLVTVYTADRSVLLGYLLLDMYPRSNKYSHAAQLGAIQAITVGNKRLPGLAIVMANFPRSTADQPALLQRSDVKTFFHEFGHAIHTLLGSTKLASQAGTHVKRDFVELPSQILEEWLYDPMILKKVSKHYQTGEPMSDELIEKIVNLKRLASGLFVQRQGILSKMALDYFAAGAEKDPYAIMMDLYARYGTGIASNPASHFYCAFGHLTGYGAKYYGYLWSKVFALDIFEQIKKEGLLNPVVGKRYAETILAPGGSAHPDELLRNFLGREPNNEAFLKDLGL
jgi:thimet oligopeptidase